MSLICLIQSLFQIENYYGSYFLVLLSIALSQNLVEGQSVLYFVLELFALSVIKRPLPPYGSAQTCRSQADYCCIRFLMFTLPINKDTAIPIEALFKAIDLQLLNSLLSRVLSYSEQPPTDTFHGIIQIYHLPIGIFELSTKFLKLAKTTHHHKANRNPYDLLLEIQRGVLCRV